VLDVVGYLRTALGTPCEVHHGPAKAGDPARTRGSHDAYTARTGWRPIVPLHDGISSTVAWFTQRHETST
jgi:UDP-glucose 4-epimerase